YRPQECLSKQAQTTPPGHFPFSPVIRRPEYSGLTKTGTALPRLAVLSVLSATSSPCPDLNLIHYTLNEIG
ncbi:hypothetical protein, partial [Neisseria gonorrhoeae]|uniref:hypothetical protein n=1 Tax=Neisseria gonorrhoeae TaxID=485 RepID=UPI001C566F8E